MDLEGIEPKDLEIVEKSDKPTIHQTLSIAYFNLAVEYEFTKQYDAAISSLNKSKFFNGLLPMPNPDFDEQIDKTLAQI